MKPKILLFLGLLCVWSCSEDELISHLDARLQASLVRISPEDALDYFMTFALFLAVLVVPFLYSRETTENFLTPKEFVAKITLAFLGGLFFLRILGSWLRMEIPVMVYWGLALAAFLANWSFAPRSSFKVLFLGSYFGILLAVVVIMTFQNRKPKPFALSRTGLDLPGAAHCRHVW